LYVYRERSLEKIFARAQKMRAQTIAIDSIQKMLCEDVGNRPGTVGQLKECSERLSHFAKTTKTTLWIIGHITSDGDVQGPKTIEHNVDVVLELVPGPKLEGRERILRCASGKNRFARTDVVGRFEMTDKGLRPIDPDGWDERL
jgi:DNA repair protein RadA/Sms